VKLLVLLLLTFFIGFVLNYFFESVFLANKTKQQDDFGLMEDGVNDGCQTSMRLLIFCLIGFFVSMWLVGFIFN